MFFLPISFIYFHRHSEMNRKLIKLYEENWTMIKQEVLARKMIDLSVEVTGKLLNQLWNGLKKGLMMRNQ